MGYVTRGMKNVFFFTVNQDIWPGKLLLVLASIIKFCLLSHGAGGLQTFSRTGMSVWWGVLTQEFELKSDQDHGTGRSW
jgi:hypothetical protein